MFGRSRARVKAPADQDLRCSFCKKDADAVRKLIAGPSVYICDECVGVCTEILSHEVPPGQPEPDPGAVRADGDSPFAARCALCRIVVVLEETTLLENRGLLCPACLEAVQVAVQERVANASDESV